MPREILRVSNHSGGRNTALGRASIEPYQSPSDLNVISEYPGTLSTRAGFQQWVNKTFGDPSRMNLGRYLKTNGDKWLIVRADGDLWGCKGDYPYTDYIQVATGLSSTSDMFFEKSQGWLIVVNGAESVKRWDGNVFCEAWLDNTSDTVFGTDHPTFADGGPATGDVVGTAVAFDYYYKVVIDYGNLGRSEPITGLLALTVDIAAGTDRSVSIGNCLALVDRHRSCGATGLSFYRTTQDPATTYGYSGFFQYYYVGSTKTNTFVDTLNDDALGSALNSLLVQTYRVGSPLYYDSDPPFGAKYVARHRNRMFYANSNVVNGSNNRVLPSHLWYSFQYQPTKIEGFEQVSPEDSQSVTGIISNGNYLAVFKQSKVYGWFGEAIEDFELRPFDTGLGCIAPKTIAVGRLSPAGPDGVFFLSEEGLAFLSGNSIEIVSADIRPDLLQCGIARLVDACGAFHQGRYYLGVP